MVAANLTYIANTLLTHITIVLLTVTCFNGRFVSTISADRPGGRGEAGPAEGVESRAGNIPG